ncbi:MAG TPA: BON domain-containing protein [Vicinamibacterales bacterium]|jgi:hypothetical protein|nr:BON domain-containing protein [Vicinamibacterales bacterium]
MIELPFGSVSPGWPAAPLSAWFPLASAIAGRAGSQPFASPPASNSATPNGPAFSVTYPPATLYGQTTLYPALVPPLAPSPINALLMSVAARRGQPNGPTSDQEVEDFIYDALELVPGASDVEVRCDAGKATLTGTVQHKRLKHDVGEIAWAIPAVTDVQNNIAIATKRRARGREPEPAVQGRKQP